MSKSFDDIQGLTSKHMESISINIGDTYYVMATQDLILLIVAAIFVAILSVRTYAYFRKQNQ